jgi:acetylglutamate kinase
MDTNLPLALIKIGGRPAGEPSLLRRLIADIRRRSSDYRFALVHGGGNVVSELSRRLGIEPRFIDGIRQTSREEMAMIDMGLAGRVNAEILRAALAEGLPAIGISGIDAGLCIGEALESDGGRDNRTGRVTKVDPGVLHYLLKGGYLPVISPVSSDIGGKGLNINADEVAEALAKAMLPEKMLFISDTPGVMNGPTESPDSMTIDRLDEAAVSELIENEVISGGMIPKVNGALQLVASGVGEVVIGDLSGGPGCPARRQRRNPGHGDGGGLSARGSIGANRWTNTPQSPAPGRNNTRCRISTPRGY